MAKRATSFTTRQIAANGRIRSLATRSFCAGRFTEIYLNFTSFTAGAVGGEDMRKISLDKANFVRYGGMPA